MIDRYILDENGNPVPEPDLLKWAAWFENMTAARIVCQDTYITRAGESVKVSTVFLGLDHNYSRFLPGGRKSQSFGKL